MIESKWSDQAVDDFLRKYGREFGEDLALRTYSARLIGQESTLVLHGGGNTSVKTVKKNILGNEIAALYVKGSGWDLATIEPEGHPGLDLNYLRELIKLDSLSDELMVNELRTHLFNANAPTPSIETLLHAFLPAKFIDHSHADAIVALTNSRNGEALARECFANDLVIVPYVMPGFALAKLAAKLFFDSPKAKGLLLLKHGLFTFAETAKESYLLHLEMVNRAQVFTTNLIKPRTMTINAVINQLRVEAILPKLRGALAVKNNNKYKRFIFSLRQNHEALNFVNHPNLKQVSQTPPITPDHIIRTKALPLVINSLEEVDDALKSYREEYERYFKRCSSLLKQKKIQLDSSPRVLLIPNIGIVGVGENWPAANIAADIYEHTAQVKTKIEAYAHGEYEGLDEKDLFDIEYWDLEQAKLATQKPKPLTGQVALITGGAGAIGIGIANILKQAGAEVVIADRKNVSEVGSELKVTGIEMDVTSETSVREGFKRVIEKFGGVDIVIPNAGIALSASIEKINEAEARRVLDVNFHGYLNTIKVAAEILKLQNTAGHIVVISSKNVFAPGKEFALYSASKAAGHQLGKVAALELAPYGIKVNMITPDAVFGTDSHPSGLWQSVGPERAKSRGMEFQDLPKFHQERSLLKTAVAAEDIGRAVLFFVSDQTPTTGATLPVDGGLAEAFPR